MTERTGLFSGENLQTIMAVTFVLALLALAFNFYNYSTINNAATVLAGINVGSIQKFDGQFVDTNKKIDDLSKQVADMKAAMEAQAKTTEAPPAAGGE